MDEKKEHTNLHKELDLIQAVIVRMAQNSFQVKAWLIGILSALVAFKNDTIFSQAGQDKAFSIELNLFLLLPIFCFWYLDAFFLSTEKLYRELYKWVIKYRPQTDAYRYDLNTFTRIVGNEEVKMLKPENGVGPMMRSKTLLPFYLVPVCFVLGVLFYNFFRS
jgi:hypothetical protein